MITVQQRIKVHELDDKEISADNELAIGVDSHWNRPALIVLVLGKHRYAVVGADLQAAVNNARNTNRH